MIRLARQRYSLLLLLLVATLPSLSTGSPRMPPRNRQRLTSGHRGAGGGRKPHDRQDSRERQVPRRGRCDPPWLLQDPRPRSTTARPIDLMARIGEELGVPVEYVDSGWDVLIAGLQSDKFDLTAAPMFATPERMEVIDFVNYTRLEPATLPERQRQGQHPGGPQQSDVTIVTSPEPAPRKASARSTRRRRSTASCSRRVVSRRSKKCSLAAPTSAPSIRRWRSSWRSSIPI